MADNDKDIEITQGPLKRKKVTLAPRDIAESFQYELEEVLDVIGHPEALITDWSSISDFFGDDQDALSDCMLRLSEMFAIDVSDAKERLVDLASRVRKARKG